jgi:hypothetical protein
MWLRRMGMGGFWGCFKGRSDGMIHVGFGSGPLWAERANGIC